MLSIKSTDLVPEIGSGNRPRRRSNILCDKFVESNYERSHDGNVVIDKRPFIVVDGIALPFKDMEISLTRFFLFPLLKFLRHFRKFK